LTREHILLLLLSLLVLLSYQLVKLVGLQRDGGTNVVPGSASEILEQRGSKELPVGYRSNCLLLWGWLPRVHGPDLCGTPKENSNQL
jgi:hypothetical protein